MADCGDAGETRTLHPLVLPSRVPDPGDAELRRGLYVDCETTGFSPALDAVIELAMLPFTYTLGGSVVEVLPDEAQVHRNDPGRPLPAEITHLTGLTDDDVRGARIDVEAAGVLIERSDLVVAHNAGFDRPFVERVLPAARARPWACTRAEVPWIAEGFASRALHCLLCAYGVYARDRHRALADSEAGVWLLAQRLPVSGESVLAAMRRRALTPTVRLWAIRSACETKEILRARGYRWMPETRNGIERAWWTDVAPGKAYFPAGRFHGVLPQRIASVRKTNTSTDGRPVTERPFPLPENQSKPDYRLPRSQSYIFVSRATGYRISSAMRDAQTAPLP